MWQHRTVSKRVSSTTDWDTMDNDLIRHGKKGWEPYSIWPLRNSDAVTTLIIHLKRWVPEDEIEEGIEGE